jgi:hypothetical protein
MNLKNKRTVKKEGDKQLFKALINFLLFFNRSFFLRCFITFFLILKKIIRVAIITIATGQGICVADRALVMTVNMNHFDYMTAKKALIHLPVN